MTSPPTNQLRVLVERHLDGSLTRLEMAELEELLRTPEAMDFYLEAVEIEAGLQRLDSLGSLAPANEFTIAPVVKLPSQHRRLLLASAAALTLLLAVGGWIALVDQPETTPITSALAEPEAAPLSEIATVVRHIGLPAPEMKVLRTGDDLVIDYGLVELEFESGPRLLLEGPARLSCSSPKAVTLHHGRCLLDIPRSNERFTLNSSHGSVWSLEGEFAAAVQESGADLEVGVFEGRAYLHNEGAAPLRIGRRDAIRIADKQSAMSIAFPFESIHRRFPTRELAWQAPSNSFAPVTMEHNLNGLIWGPGPYRVYFKWMHGPDALKIHSSEILLNGEAIASDVHLGVAGDPLHTDKHAYQFKISDDDFCTGDWSLRTVVQTNPRQFDQIQLPDEILNPYGVILLAGDPRLTLARKELQPTLSVTPNSNGVLLVEQGRAAEPYEFCHEWEYVYNGLVYRRAFFANGTARLERDGEVLPNFDRATWTVEDGVLSLSICHPDTDDLISIERHLLRDDGTLLFLDRPYRNAQRIGVN